MAMTDENNIMLEVTGLKKRFGDDVVLDGVDLNVRRGEVTVILGSSGCGKSTLLRCINGLEASDSGTIRIDGEEVIPGAKNLPRLRQKIGMVFQSYDLFPHKNILDNITLAPIKVQKRSRENAQAQAEQLLSRGLETGDALVVRDLVLTSATKGREQRVLVAGVACEHDAVLAVE